jgi:hypothetical protein
LRPGQDRPDSDAGNGPSGGVDQGGGGLPKTGSIGIRQRAGLLLGVGLLIFGLLLLIWRRGRRGEEEMIVIRKTDCDE